MITTNTTKIREKEDDGKRRIITTTNMKPTKVRFMQTEFPGVQKRETNKVDPSVKFNTTELDGLMKNARPTFASMKLSAPKVDAPVIKTPQPKPAKKAVPKKRKAK